MQLLRSSPSAARRRLGWSNGSLLVICILLIGTGIWMRPELWPMFRNKPRPQLSAADIAEQIDNLPLSLKTQTRGLRNMGHDNGTKYLMVQCHRGQFSNRLMCVKAGVLLARALQRVFVLPKFTDVDPIVDVSKYVSLECLRRNGQAVTFDEFQRNICHEIGLGVPRTEEAGAGPNDNNNSNHQNETRGVFCKGGAVLRVEDGYSLADYRGYGCWERREDITNARDLGVEVGQCKHVLSVNKTDPYHAYNLAEIQDRFAGLTDTVLLFLDLFGVNLLPNRGDLAQTVNDPSEMCGWMPTEAAAAAADAVMQSLIPPVAAAAAASVGWPAHRQIQPELPGGDTAAVAAVPAAGAGEASSHARAGRGGEGAVQMASSGWRHRALLRSEAAAGPTSAPAAATQDAAALASTATGDAQEPPTESGPSDPDGRPPFSPSTHLPKVRLRGTRSYAALHLRRADWFYYCGGLRRCFYSMTEVGRWLNASLAGRGLDTLYVSTNADEREKQMLRRSVSARVLFWEDIVAQLRSWQSEGLAAPGAAGADVAPPHWIQSLPLDDELMVQMVEKAICMQSAFFVSSKKSTFSNQIREFRDGGLAKEELETLLMKFGDAAVTAAITTASSGAPAGGPDPRVNGAPAGGHNHRFKMENATFVCANRPPQLPDDSPLPDFYNPDILMDQLGTLFAPVLHTAATVWHWATGRGDGNATFRNTTAVTAYEVNETAVAPPITRPVRQQRRLTLTEALLVPWRTLVRWVLVIEDGHAMAAANRFVAMYTGGAVAGLVLEGRLRVPPSAYAECVAREAASAGAEALHVSMVDVPEDQQVLLMQELETRGSVRQVTRITGPQQERGNTFTMMYHGEGLARHAEPALLEELPTFLGRVDAYVLVKARVLLGDSRSVLFGQVQNTRRLFGLDSPADGACGVELLDSN